MLIECLLAANMTAMKCRVQYTGMNSTCIDDCRNPLFRKMPEQITIDISPALPKKQTSQKSAKQPKQVKPKQVKPSLVVPSKFWIPDEIKSPENHLTLVFEGEDVKALQRLRDEAEESGTKVEDDIITILCLLVEGKLTFV